MTDLSAEGNILTPEWQSHITMELQRDEVHNGCWIPL